MGTSLRRSDEDGGVSGCLPEFIPMNIGAGMTPVFTGAGIN